MLDQVKDLLSEIISIDTNKVTMESRIKEDLNIDSLDAVEMMLELETRLGILVEWSEMRDLETINDFVNLVSKKVKEKENK